jgi:hypothetical protein
MIDDLDSTDLAEPVERDWKGELRVLYAELDREVAGIGPVCKLSGRCCRFEEYGHTLFISTAEAEYLVDGACACARLWRDVSVAGFARALHGARCSAAGLPYLLL